MAGRFSVNDKVITDSKTGLMWSKESSRSTWTQAKAYCAALTTGGHNDWRLPDVSELRTIVNRSCPSPVTFDEFSFQIAFDHWSSTVDARNSTNAWIVNFSTGNDNTPGKGNNNYVICVR